ncbi:MAG: DNA polymerase III subunit alpha [Nitrospirota bacterium]|nr:DNA polymerase III subunit alpha [Nitrospirota bacterium]
MRSEFVHLHLHTQYSLLDGANQLTPLFQQVKEHGMPAVAMTDHGNLFGAIDFYQKGKHHGIKPIIGCEAYMAPGSRSQKSGHTAHTEYYHLILLATNQVGYHNLIKLSSKAYLEGFYYKPRMDKELLQEHHEGLIALSGCLSGEIPQLIGQQDLESAMRVADEYRTIFGKDHYFLEVQANGLEQQHIANRGLMEIHKKLEIPLVGTNDCHYLTKRDARPHEIMLCLQTGKTLKDPNRMKFDTDQLYVKSMEEMVAEFAEFPRAALNTTQVAEQCDLSLEFGATYLPDYHVPEGQTHDSYLLHLSEQGLRERLRERPTSIPLEAYQHRLTTELSVLNAMGYAGYFLVVWDIINFARSRKIPVGPGRGSAAGSLVAYALRITDLDPLVYNLLFERFLNPERVSMPDIDMDFCMDRRGEVINYVIEKYGEAHVCQIITFGTLGAKAAIRDVGRVMDFPYADVDKVAKLVPTQLNITLKDALKQEPRLQELVDGEPGMKELMDTAMALEGLARHASTHAAGVVISQKPLMEHVPLYKTSNDEVVTQYTMTDLEKVGLVKFDFLGLKTLTMIHDAVKHVHASQPADAQLDIQNLPLSDPDTFALLSSGKTSGIFQLESSGMRNLLVKIQPETFEDLIAILALYRPGPLESGMVDDFIKRKRDPTQIVYEPPQLEPILKETYGVIVYQEQVMAITNQLAGFSLGQADLLRRAMGKKKHDEMAKQKTLFISGGKEKGIAEKLAEKIFDQMAFFAGYGFNKSHSAAYALVTFQTAYLKAHYPTEFMAALLTSEMGNTDKMVGYFTECRELGVKILPPDANQSLKNFSVVPEGIRFGMAAIKNVGESAVDIVLEARDQDGPFLSFVDFCCRLDSQKVNKRVLEGLIKVGAFDSMGTSRASLFDVLDQIMEHASTVQRNKREGQTSLFDFAPETPSKEENSSFGFAIPPKPEWSQNELLQHERELTGFYITDHPLNRHRMAIAHFSTCSTQSLGEMGDGREVKLCGVISSLKITTTKKGNRMAYVQLEDLQGTVEAIVFPEAFKNHEDMLKPDSVIRITGSVDLMDNGARIKATRVELVPQLECETVKHVTLQIHEEDVLPHNLVDLKNIFDRHPGPTPISLAFHLQPDMIANLPQLPNVGISPTPEFLEEVEHLLGTSTVAFH